MKTSTKGRKAAPSGGAHQPMLLRRAARTRAAADDAVLAEAAAWSIAGTAADPDAILAVAASRTASHRSFAAVLAASEAGIKRPTWGLGRAASGRRAPTATRDAKLAKALACVEVEVGRVTAALISANLAHAGVRITPDGVFAALRSNGWERDAPGPLGAYKPGWRDRGLYFKHAPAFYDVLHRDDPRLNAAQWSVVRGHLLKRYMAGNYAAPQPGTVRGWIR